MVPVRVLRDLTGSIRGDLERGHRWFSPSGLSGNESGKEILDRTPIEKSRCPFAVLLVFVSVLLAEPQFFSERKQRVDENRQDAVDRQIPRVRRDDRANDERDESHALGVGEYS